MSFAELCFQVFVKSVCCYHLIDDVDAEMNNPYLGGSVESELFAKHWVDAVQWHLEDLIRDPEIDACGALVVKRRIDALNQKRTGLVEGLDDFFEDRYRHVEICSNARFNTESPAWAIDRLSILALKIYHMEQEVIRCPGSEHGKRCEDKLRVLLAQKEHLVVAIDQLLADVENGRVRMTTYKQMKMYNDPNLNPVLYEKRKNDD